MPIKYFPNRVFSKRSSPVDAITARTIQYEQKGVADTTATALDVTISSETDWNVSSISVTFDPATTEKDYSFYVVKGVRIVENYNDFLWMHVYGTHPQQITLDPGFYTGTELAQELQDQMDATQAYIDAAITFTVTYTATTGLFSITPSSSTIRYLNVNTSKTLRTRDSICGFIFGLTETTTLAGSVTSDTAVPGYDSSLSLVCEENSINASDYINDGWVLSRDEAIRIQSSVAALTVNYSVRYSKIDDFNK